MSKSIVGIAKNRLDVETVVDDLQASGISAADISILIPDSGGIPETVMTLTFFAFTESESSATSILRVSAVILRSAGSLDWSMGVSALSARSR